MANLQHIKARIANVNSTKKITRAMYLIAASKNQKAKGQLAASAPYFQQITANMAEILACSEQVNTPFIASSGPEDGAPKARLFLVLGGDKGMAGGYNHNLEALVLETANPETDELMVAGSLARNHFRQKKYRVDNDFDFPVMNPNLYRARDVAEAVITKYNTGNYREISVIYTEMISGLQQRPTVLQLLPLNTEALREYIPAEEFLHEIEYLPGTREVFEHLVPHYLRGILYSAFVEAFASEQSARMLAMDGATKSADETISGLTISYNRVRQAKITQELTEIISGIPQE